MDDDIERVQLDFLREKALKTMPQKVCSVTRDRFERRGTRRRRKRRGGGGEEEEGEKALYVEEGGERRTVVLFIYSSLTYFFLLPPFYILFARRTVPLLDRYLPFLGSRSIDTPRLHRV